MMDMPRQSKSDYPYIIRGGDASTAAALATKYGALIGKVHLAPTNTAGEWARFIAVAAACASGGYPLHLLAGAWLVDATPSQRVLPSNLDLTLENGSVFTATLPGGTWDKTPFSATFTEAVSGSTTLHAANVVGTRLLVAHAGFSVGDYVMPHDLTALSYRRQIYQVTASADNGDGTFNITVDRPVMLQYAVDDELLKISDFPRNIHIHAYGAKLTGVMARGVNLTGAWDCSVEGLRVDASSGDGPTAGGVCWDEGCLRCHSRDCYVDLTGEVGTAPGFTIETSEHCSHIESTARNVPGAGILINDCVSCMVDSAHVSGAGTNGIVVDATDGTLGSSDCTVRRSDCVGCTTAGILVQGASKNIVLNGVTCLKNQRGVQLDESCDEVTVTNANLSYNSEYGLAMISAIRPILSNIVADRNTLYGMRVIADCTITGYRARNNGTGAMTIDAGTPTVKVIDAQAINDLADSKLQFVLAVAGRLELLKVSVGGTKSNIGAYNTSTGTIVLQDTTLTGGAGSTGYLAADAANTLIDRGGNSYTVNLLGASAKINTGTWVANGATEVTIANPLAAAGMRLRVGMSVLGGTPAGQPFQSALTAGTSFGMKAGAGDTSTYAYTIEL